MGVLGLRGRDQVFFTEKSHLKIYGEAQTPLRDIYGLGEGVGQDGLGCIVAW